ncbi:MAG: hypothetical protein H7X95_08220 [Deltaproteobacteria bacterium]|nr:hypothetical protein [Deltaproteobacteria bacterium]
MASGANPGAKGNAGGHAGGTATPPAIKAPAVVSPPPSLPPPLPAARPVDTILTDIVAAVGGVAALKRHQSLHTKMEITFKGLGITGTAEHYAAAGDKALTVTEIPNLASTREGSDGKQFWSEDPINGLRLLEGVEAEQARIEAAWNAELRMKELFHKIQAENQRGEDGRFLECLTLTPKVGAVVTNCFDAKTHLLATQKGVRSGPQGDMPFTARLSDWRAVGDVKMAFATDMQVGPLAFAGRVTSVEMDVPIDPQLFAPKVLAPKLPDKSAKSAKSDKPEKSQKPKRPNPSEKPAAPTNPAPR